MPTDAPEIENPARVARLLNAVTPTLERNRWIRRYVRTSDVSLGIRRGKRLVLAIPRARWSVEIQ